MIRRFRPLGRLCFSRLPLIVAGAFCLLAGGCSSLQPSNWRTLPSLFGGFSGEGGDLVMRSAKDENVTLQGAFDSGVYAAADRNTATIVLFAGEPEAPTQVVTIRMFWNPQAGRTPVDPTATNATIQYIIFSGNEVGIYSGAGYLYPKDDLDGETFAGSIWQSTLRLSDKTEGFVDQLGSAQMEGKFKVSRDDVAIDQKLHRLNVQIREKLGRSRLVKVDHDDATLR
ncbi:MAG: hypothetical protein WD768_14685 [Phycisphaeraceae bacterium]